LKNIEEKLANESKIQTLDQFTKDIYKSLTQSGPKSKAARDAVLEAYSKLVKQDNEAFKASILAERGTLRTNLDDLYVSKLPFYSNFREFT
jgi:hypothetical protein